MTMETTVMVSGLLSAIGAGYCIYGKRQRQVIPLLTGIALCVYPYFVSNGYALVAIGLLLMALPWWVRF